MSLSEVPLPLYGATKDVCSTRKDKGVRKRKGKGMGKGARKKKERKNSLDNYGVPVVG